MANETQMTEDERQEDELITRWIKGVIGARKRINEKHGKQRGAKGVIECPFCGGELHYTISKFNGHVHAACITTQDCLRWVE